MTATHNGLTPHVPASSGFGQALRTMREHARLSQSNLAFVTGLNTSYISRLESGSRQPTRNAVEAIVVALGLSRGDACDLLVSAGYLPAGMPVAVLRALAEEMAL